MKTVIIAIALLAGFTPDEADRLAYVLAFTLTAEEVKDAETMLSEFACSPAYGTCQYIADAREVRERAVLLIELMSNQI